MRKRRRSVAVLKWIATVVLVFVLLTAVPVLALRWIDPPTSAFMLTDRSERPLRYQWVDMENISPHAAIAVVAAEDQLFPHHWGFDFNSIREAVEANGRRTRIRGASTISQQVAKNLFLWRDRTWLRKGVEAWFTVLLEALWPKQRILEVYLNIAEFGRGIYGVEAASRHFYGKPASRLNAHEAALLAAVLPNPRRFRVDRPSAYVLSRQDWILDQMRGLGGASYLDGLKETTARR